MPNATQTPQPAAKPAFAFTPAQAAAITARGGSLLVSAAAGSGKTRVLVERVVGLITDAEHPVEADRLLIMTFTNAAAAKLRADIAKRLAEAVHANPGNMRLRGQQLKLQRASIGTVDAFCLHFVQQHFAMLDIPPDFETAETAELARIEQETLAAVLEEAYQDEDFRAFADLYDRGRTDGTAGKTVLELYTFTRSLPHPEKSLEEFAAMWQNGTPPQNTAWGKAVLDHARLRVAGAQQLLRRALELAARDEAAEAAYAGVLEQDLDKLDALTGALQGADWDGIVAAFGGFGKWGSAGRIKGGKASNEMAMLASDLRDKAKKQVSFIKEDLLLCTAAEYEADRARTAPLVAALCRTVQKFAEECFAAKCSEKLLDYADYEHLTLDLLQTPQGKRTPLCRTVSERYAAVLVDEYQDTNALQDAIYFALANPAGDNLFFVGDIKQSIYRFRQADPTVFLGKQQAWSAWPQPAPRPATLALDKNFRSAPAVIEGINYFFSVFFSQSLGGVDYGPGQRLVVGVPDGGYAGHCELQAVLEGDVAAEARVIAARIRQMVDDGFAVRGKGGTRPCRPEDFCILLRGRRDFPVYEGALRDLSLPTFADSATDLLDAAHIRPFAALLRVIDNPAQDIPLAAVLLSPMFPYTADDLVALRSATPKGSLYSAVLYGGQQRFAPFLERLAEYRRLARTLPVDALLEELLADTGYLAAVGAMPDGVHCREDLLAFTGWAAGAGRSGLPSVIRAMDAAAQSGGISQSTGGGQTRPGCVSIMTVHRSKGLEFPVVFVANTAHRFNNSDIIRPVLSHAKQGVGLTLRVGSGTSRYKTLAYAAISQSIKQESMSEEMRVLYVALTRAQDALIITVPLQKPESELKTPALYAAAQINSAVAMQSFTTWSGWLLTAALMHPGSGALWAAAGAPPMTIPNASPVTITVTPAPPPAPPAAPQGDALPDETLEQALQARFAWVNPDAALQAIPAKVSVSAVAHAARPVALERPAFLQKGGMTGAERGTALHAFLQSVPFDSAAPPDLTAEVERQVGLKLLDPALAEKLDLNRLTPFFESDVWQRIGTANAVWREEPFITALPAAQITPAAAGTGAEVLVQGIADLVLVFADHAEILDYKTDRSTDPAFYQKEYTAQLQLYQRAFAQRLPVPVTKLTIYSFTLAAEIDIPLGE